MELRAALKQSEKTVNVLYNQKRCNKTDITVLLDTLKSCSRARNLERGKQVHAEAADCGHEHVVNALINMYAKCGSMVDARDVFDAMDHQTVVSWNTLILGYADNGQGQAALDMFIRMRTRGTVPNSATLLAALKAVEQRTRLSSECRDRSKEIHNIAVESQCGSDVYLQSALIDLYSKCGSMDDAFDVFYGMKNPDVVSWNVLILGYAENGQGNCALNMLTRMTTEGPAPNFVTLVASLKACISLTIKGTECRDRGKEIHNIAVENGCNSNVYVQTTLIDMYSKCNSMKDAYEVFVGVKSPDIVSWNSLILGYADNGQGYATLDMFIRMKNEGPVPSSVTFGAALKACGLVGALDFGRRIHSEIDSGNEFHAGLVTFLVDFYAKCGSLMEAQNVFDLHAETRNLRTWNALLGGFSSCGDNEAVFRLFKRMQDEGFRPDGTTFLCILTCCTHAGLVMKGKECFDAMSTKYGVTPIVKHYTCMIDLLGRANKLDDAIVLLKQMPCSPDAVIWMTVLEASRKWKNLEIGKLAFQSLADLGGARNF